MDNDTPTTDTDAPATQPDAPTAQEPEPATTEETETGALAEDVRQVKTLIEERLRYDEAKEKAFTRLLTDLDAAREQLNGDHLRPVFKAIIQLYDHAKSSLDVLEGEGREHMEVLCEGLLDTLYRLDVDMMQDTPERFDRKTQYVVRKVPTNNPDEDWTIERVVHAGFTWRDRVIRPQEVIVRRLESTKKDQG